MILYHFPTSPYGRRVRMTLAMKGLTAELRDARSNPEHAAEVRRLNPVGKVPVLVDGERVICDSAAICAYLDEQVPAPRLFPAGTDAALAHEIVALTNYVIDTFVDLGLRSAALADHARYAEVCAQYMQRVNGAFVTLAKYAAATGDGKVGVAGDTWSVADIALFTFVTWLEGLPARAAAFPPAQQMLNLGWTLPSALVTWADAHRNRPDAHASAANAT